MTDTEKPRRKPGTFCPLWRKDVSKVCHTCDWWKPLTVENAQKEVFVHWDCAMNHQMTIMRDVGFGVLGTQQATESFRNEFVARADQPEVLPLGDLRGERGLLRPQPAVEHQKS